MKEFIYTIGLFFYMFEFLSECADNWELYDGRCYSLVSATYSIFRSIEEASEVCEQSHPSSRLPSLHSLGAAR